MASRIRIERVWRRIEELARLTDPQQPYTRRSFSELHLRSRRWLMEQFQEAGLAVSVDAGGNLVGRREGLRNDLPPIVTGSHSDTVVGGGRFDGAAGLIAALEVAQVLGESGQPLSHPLEAIDFLAEEPSEYGIACVGSRALSGSLSPEMLTRTAPNGTTLAQSIDRFGGSSDRLANPVRSVNSLAGFFEVHIEQGRVLEESHTAIGIVTAIAGITRLSLTLTGRADHAGSTPMALRRDALVCSARIIQHIDELARRMSQELPFLVATVGEIQVHPNLTNVVPGWVKMILEVRTNRDADSDAFLEAVQEGAGQIAVEQGIDFTSQRLSYSPPTACSEVIQDTIRRACESLQLSYRFMASGAGHDTRYMAALGPAGMIFIPCLDGRSHCPEEWVDQEQLAAGVEALLATIELFDREHR